MRLSPLPLLLLRTLSAAAVLLALHGPVQAQEEGAEAAPTEQGTAGAPRGKGAKQPTAEEASRTSDVVGYKFPRGIYTQSDLGLFWRYLGFADLGGTNQCYRCKYPTYYVSNAQPYLGFSVGYDVWPTVTDYIPGLKIPEIAQRVGMSLQLSVGTGYVANASPYSNARSNSLNPANPTEETRMRAEESPKDHAILMMHPAVVFNVIPPLFERLLLEGRLFVGGAAFTPSAQRFEKFVSDPRWWMATFGGDFGFGASIKYMTLLPGFVVGSDLALYTLTSPGWGTEVFVPPWGTMNEKNKVAPWGLFVSDSGGGTTEPTKKPMGIIPFIWATSFSPIIIKYVF